MNSFRRACSKTAAAVPRHVRRFGGDRRYRHPEIYSPAGGWWNANPNAKRNTGIVFGIVAALAIPIATISSRLEVRCLLLVIVSSDHTRVVVFVRNNSFVLLAPVPTA